MGNWNQAFTLRAGGQKTGQDGQGEASNRAWCWLLWPHHRCRTHSQGVQDSSHCCRSWVPPSPYHCWHSVAQVAGLCDQQHPLQQRRPARPGVGHHRQVHRLEQQGGERGEDRACPQGVQEDREHVEPATFGPSTTLLPTLGVKFAELACLWNLDATQRLNSF